jgi:type II secretion system protein L
VTDLLILWLPGDPGGQIIAQPVIGGLSGQSVAVDEWPEEERWPERVVAFSPVSLTGFTKLSLPKLPPLQRDAVAREQLAARFAGPVHLVSGEGVAESSAPVAWLDPSIFSAWLAALAELALKPNAIIPAALLLEGEAGPCRAILCGEEVWAEAGDVVPADMGIEADRPARALNTTSLAQAAARLAGAPPINLLSGAFAPKMPSPLSGQGRSMAVLAGIALLATVLLPHAQAWRANHDADAIEAETRAAAARAFPSAADPVAALGAGITARRGGGAGFLPSLTALSQAVESVSAAELAQLRYAPDGWIDVSVRFANAADLSAAEIRLKATGFRVQRGVIRSEQGRQVAQLRISG